MHEKQLMLENDTEMQTLVENIVADMLAEGAVKKKVYTDWRSGREYYNLITPNAFDKQLVTVAVLGYPERAGVWSYTLLRQSRIAESSMQSYFKEFAEHDIGLVAIDPNSLEPDIEGDSFIYQLEQVAADIAAAKKIAFVGFSMGGRILVEFLEQRAELLSRVAGLVLIDPTLPNRLNISNIRSLLDNNTLLIASEGEVTSPGEIASVLLHIPKISLPGIHGQMPNKALPQIISFLNKRKP